MSDYKYTIGTLVRNTLTGVRGPIIALSPAPDTYEVEYQKIGIRRNQPARQLEVYTQKARPGLRPHKQYEWDSELFTNFIDFLKVSATIRVQLPQASFEGFRKRYFTATGENITPTTPFVSIIVETAKWGASVTVLFPSSGAHLVPDGIKAAKYVHDADMWSVYGNDFAYELFEKGFRLGRAAETFCEKQY